VNKQASAINVHQMKMN